MWMYLMPLNRTLKNGSGGKLNERSTLGWIMSTEILSLEWVGWSLDLLCEAQGDSSSFCCPVSHGSEHDLQVATVIWCLSCAFHRRDHRSWVCVPDRLPLTSEGSGLSPWTRDPQPPGSDAWDDLRQSWWNNYRNKVHNKCNALESSPNHSPPPTPVRGKIVFHKTSPWCQKDWGQLP